MVVTTTTTAPSPPPVLLLAGAPARRACAAGAAALTVTEWLPAFRRVLRSQGSGVEGFDCDCGVDESSGADVSDGASSEATRAGGHDDSHNDGHAPRWRALAVTSNAEDASPHLRTGWSQQSWLGRALNDVDDDDDDDKRHDLDGTTRPRGVRHAEQEPSFPSATTEDSSSSAAASDYLERSFALHETADAAALSPACETPLPNTAIERVHNRRRKRRWVRDEDGVEPLSALSPGFELPALPNLTSLDRIPSAAALEALRPQTVTADLVAGVICVEAPRTVAVHGASGRESELVEALLGDETRRGFPMTFWLPTRPSHPNLRRAITSRGGGISRAPPAVDDFRRAVLSLRAGDVVCIRHVALGHFRGVVRGQSLGRGMTSVSVVPVAASPPGLRCQLGDRSPVVAKIRRVEQWVRMFVAAANHSVRTRSEVGAATCAASLPADETPR